MTLYLTSDLTPAEIHKASAAGVRGVKSYPRGVTTNSQGGVEDYTTYFDVFEAMQECGMVLNIHGEVPSNPELDVCVMNAEERFLDQLEIIHKAFPRLRIVLEHATTAAAVHRVMEMDDHVACTITVHHLQLTVDDWAGKSHNYCKPVAKYPSDRRALRDAVKSGNRKFFLGSDSAPHPRHLKECASACAGVFTTPHAMAYLAHILSSFDALDKLSGFACEFGRAFYGLEPMDTWIELEQVGVQESFSYGEGEVVPFMAGQTLHWQVNHD